MSQPENPPAFPTFEREQEWSDRDQRYNEIQIPFGGMTLRDWFAGLALQGMLASPNDHFDGMGDLEKHTQRAYQYADVMLQERSK